MEQDFEYEAGRNQASRQFHMKKRKESEATITSLTVDRDEWQSCAWHHSARAEKAEAERDMARLDLQFMTESRKRWQDATTTARRDRDAIAAAAFEAAAEYVVSSSPHDKQLEADNIRALTPADARATLDRMLRQAKAEGMKEAAGISFPRDWRDSPTSKGIKEQRYYSHGFNACRDVILARAAEIESHK